MLLLLGRSLATNKAARKRRVDLEESLLSGQDEEQGISLDNDETGDEDTKLDRTDPYKGQGASFRRMMSLSYPERYILIIATLALFMSSAATVITPAVSFLYLINGYFTNDASIKHQVVWTINRDHIGDQR
jgi:hypothetical protein